MNVFSGQGAVVQVAPDTGALAITHRFAMPDEAIGCPQVRIARQYLLNEGTP